VNDDDTLTRQQKARIRDRLDDLGVTLPDWVYAGAFVRDLRQIVQLVEHAKERAASEASTRAHGLLGFEFLEPSGELTPQLLQDLLSLVLPAEVTIPDTDISRWTAVERIIAYDWAMRGHLAASDNPIQTRSTPWFIGRYLT